MYTSSHTSRRNVLTLAVVAALMLPLAAFAASSGATGTASPGVQPAAAAQSTTASGQTGSSSGKVTTLKKVTVLGSLIPRSQIEGAAPVRIITGAQIKAEGFQTTYEFLNSLPQVSGNLSLSTSWGSTAPNAQPINLRGLGPQYTLLLVNGQRMVDYPAPQNGTGNYMFQNAANIPVGMIERVEVMATGASAMYGSDAVAGVINIVLKNHYEGDQFTARVGTDTAGGQNLDDLAWNGGRAGKKWSLVYSVEHKNRGILQGSNRPKYANSNTNIGYGSWTPAQRMFGLEAGTTGTSDSDMALIRQDGTYVTPPPGACEAFPGQERVTRYNVPITNNTLGVPQVLGPTCVDPMVNRKWTFSPGLIENDGYVHGQYDLTPNLSVYGTVEMFINNGTYNYDNPGMGQYAPGMPEQFYDETTGSVITNYIRRFSDAEMGNNGNNHDHEKYWNLLAGVKGSFGNYDWDANISSQKYILHDNYSAKNEGGMFNYFFGPQLGTTDIGGTTMPVYKLDSSRFWNPLTPAEYAQFGVYGENSSSSVLDAVNFNINNTDLVNIPWNDKPVGWAAVVQAEHYNYWLNPDPRSVPSNALHFQDPFGLYNAGGGTRQHYAVGTEFSVPITEMLTWDIAGRWDKYNDASLANTARTWHTGLQFRPFKSLLLRGTYGTNFRAPDLDAIYLQGSINPMGLYSDPLTCIEEHNTVCPAVSHPFGNEITGGNKNLLPMTGRSWTMGFVWSVPWVSQLSFQADYWNIDAKNEIDWSGTSLADEAGCLTGLTVSGAPYTAHPQNSLFCKEAIANVVRNAQGVIMQYFTGPINEAITRIGGIDAALHYTLNTDNLGTFRFGVNYTDTLEDKSKTLASDPFTNNRPGIVKTRTTWTVDWNRGRWAATIHGLAWGQVHQPNFNGCERLENGMVPATGASDCVLFKGYYAPWVTWDGMVSYQATKALNVALNVDNMFNAMPSFPFYLNGIGGFQQNSTPAGRSIFLTATYHMR